MGLDLRRVTVYERMVDPRTGDIEMRLAESHPVIRLMHGTGTYPVFLQDGTIYGEGGDVIVDPPAWVDEAMALCTDSALQSAGFPFWKQEYRAKRATSAPPNGPPIAHTRGLERGESYCPECGEVLSNFLMKRHRKGHRSYAPDDNRATD